MPIIFKLNRSPSNILNKFLKILHLLYYDSMGMLSSKRMVENDSDGVVIRNLVNKLILILNN